METEISGRVRNVELVKIIDWIPKVWHHLNRFLEAHSSSDVTIGKWAAGWAQGGDCREDFPWALARTATCKMLDRPRGYAGGKRQPHSEMTQATVTSMAAQMPKCPAD